MTLGINAVKVSLIVTLAKLGGEATIGQLLKAIQPVDGPPVARTTVLRHLRELSASGYVSTTSPIREGSRTIWQLHPERLHSDLRALIDESTPKERP